MSNQQPKDITAHYKLDTVGLICPEPIMLLHKSIRNAKSGEIIHISANDPATTRDIPNFCRHLGHTLLAENHQIQDTSDDPYANVYEYWVQKK